MSPAALHLEFMRGAALSALPPFRASFAAQCRELAGLIIQAGCSSPLFSDAECIAIVNAASGRNNCPPLGENEGTRSVTVPVPSGPRAGTTTAQSSNIAMPLRKLARTAKPKVLSLPNYDLFPDLYGACLLASPKKRQTSVSGRLPVVPSRRRVVGNGGSSDGSL